MQGKLCPAQACAYAATLAGKAAGTVLSGQFMLAAIPVAVAAAAGYELVRDGEEV